MYINHICKVSLVFKYILFADDTNLLCCDRDLNELVRVINGGLTTADMFFVNRLSRNISKTNYTIFGNRRITADICVVLKCGVTHTNILCLVLLQKRVIRLICGAKILDHTNLLFHNVQHLFLKYQIL